MNRVKADITIIGAGLTGLTLAYYLRRAGKQILILEKKDRVGGVINTLNENGFIFETGPNTGIIGTIEIVELFDDLKDKIQVEIANPQAKIRWIWKKERWHALPSGFISAVTTPLFSVKDKFRILSEPFRKPGRDPDETIAGMVIRRLGRSYLDYAVDPFISGIYAGDPGQLVTRFALPKLYNLEQNYGSFIKGALRKKKKQKSEQEIKVSREVFSIKGGLKKLIDTLYSEVGSRNVLAGCANLVVKPTNNGFITNLVYKNPEPVQIASDQIITTISGNNLSPVLPFITGNEMQAITNTAYANIVQVVACYYEWKGKPLKAFGGLIPSKENRDCLGILFPAALFEGRAPEKGAILSVFLGGIKKPEMVYKSDDEIENIVLSEIKETLQCQKKPDLLRIYRYENAIPQYEKSTGERLEAIENIQKKYPGLIVAGNIRDGIGMADRVKQGKSIAFDIIQKPAYR